MSEIREAMRREIVEQFGLGLPTEKLERLTDFILSEKTTLEQTVRELREELAEVNEYITRLKNIVEENDFKILPELRGELRTTQQQRDAAVAACCDARRYAEALGVEYPTSFDAQFSAIDSVRAQAKGEVKREELSENRRLRKALLVENNGLPAIQKDGLVDWILAFFADPDHWPMTDGQRGESLRTVYKMARRIRDTENAIQETK